MPNTPKAVRIIKPHIANPMCCAICLKFAVAVISSLFLIFLFLMRIQELRELSFKLSSNPQPIGFSGILVAKRQNSFYCTYFLHNRNVADTKSPYPIKRLEVIRWFNQKSMVFNQSLS
ncbi:hypothetical protein M096_3022 [Parabacteroides distasonis str. 3999B T(B) 6]|nr:hypothetical protein M096_3022 [Parabacteroides distasonis str. 3999B T(B) 6]